MKANSIVTAVLLNGAEIVGRFVEQDENTITIYKPRLVSPQQQGLAFVPGIAMTGVEPNGDFQFAKHSVLYVIETQEQIAGAWQKATSGLEMPTGADVQGLIT